MIKKILIAIFFIGLGINISEVRAECSSKDIIEFVGGVAVGISIYKLYDYLNPRPERIVKFSYPSASLYKIKESDSLKIKDEKRDLDLAVKHHQAYKRSLDGLQELSIKYKECTINPYNCNPEDFHDQIEVEKKIVKLISLSRDIKEKKERLNKSIKEEESKKLNKNVFKRYLLFLFK